MVRYQVYEQGTRIDVKYVENLADIPGIPYMQNAVAYTTWYDGGTSVQIYFDAMVIRNIMMSDNDKMKHKLTSIVAHEAVHAGIYIYAMAQPNERDVILPESEKLPYLVGSITYKLLKNIDKYIKDFYSSANSHDLLVLSRG